MVLFRSFSIEDREIRVDKGTFSLYIDEGDGFLINKTNNSLYFLRAYPK